MKGAKVLLKDAIFTINWKGEIVLKMDPSLALKPMRTLMWNPLTCLIFRPSTTWAAPWSTPMKNQGLEKRESVVSKGPDVDGPHRCVQG